MMAFNYHLITFSCSRLSDPSIFLTSRENGLVTIYSVAATHRTVHYIGNAPQVLRTLPACSKRRGYGFFRHPCSELFTDFTFLELSEQGAIYSTQILVEDEPSPGDTTQTWLPEEQELSTEGAIAATRMRKGGLGREWSLSVEALEDTDAADAAKPALGAWGEREKEVVDLSEIYKGAVKLCAALVASIDWNVLRCDTDRVFVDGGSGTTGYGECLPDVGAHASSLAGG